MRMFCCSVVLFFLFFLTLEEVNAQRIVEEKEVENATSVVESPLKAFQEPDREKVNQAVNYLIWLGVMIFCVLGVALILYFYFYEPSYASSPYSPTKVERPEGFVAYRRSSHDELD